MAFRNPESQAAIREAGGLTPLVDLCKDALNTWVCTEADRQAAQHGAAALWILAAEKECKHEIFAQDALRTLAAMLGGKAGAKAEANAAGALLALGRDTAADPVSVMC